MADYVESERRRKEEAQMIWEAKEGEACAYS